MPTHYMTRSFIGSAIALGSIALAACSDRTTGPLSGDAELLVRPYLQGGVTINPVPTDGIPLRERFTICKRGSTASIFVSETQPAFGTTSGTFALADRNTGASACLVVADFEGAPGDPKNATALSAQETVIPAGFQLDSIVVLTQRFAPNGGPALGAPARTVVTGSSTWTAPETIATATGITATFYNSLAPGQIRGCTFTQGYYKNHEETVEALLGPGGTLFIGGRGNLTAAQLDVIYHTPPKGGNAQIILEHQLITAKLNIIGGASAPAEVTQAIAEADLLLVGGVSAGERNLAIKLAGTLDAYNNGRARGGPGHCS